MEGLSEEKRAEIREEAKLFAALLRAGNDLFQDKDFAHQDYKKLVQGLREHLAGRFLKGKEFLEIRKGQGEASLKQAIAAAALPPEEAWGDMYFTLCVLKLQQK
jgi:hypothetical protein